MVLFQSSRAVDAKCSRYEIFNIKVRGKQRTLILFKSFLSLPTNCFIKSCLEFSIFKEIVCVIFEVRPSPLRFFSCQNVFRWTYSTALRVTRRIKAPECYHVFLKTAIFLTELISLYNLIAKMNCPYKDVSRQHSGPNFLPFSATWLAI